MEEHADIDDLVALLAWYQDAGVDCALADEPIDWLARGTSPPGAGFAWPQSPAAAAPPAAGSATTSDALSRPPAASTPSRPASPPPRSPYPDHPAAAASRPGFAPLPPDSSRAPPSRFATAPPDAAETDARRIAAAAPDLAALAAALERFDGCALKATAKSTCVYRGAAKARLAILGEAPGRDEDLEGRPFVGRAGQLLDLMLKAIDLDEGDVHITNVVYWRPPGNRTPTPQETQVCRPFLERQIALVEPDILLLLGGAAAKAVLDTEEGIMKLRGKWREATLGGRTFRAMATLHPAYLLRTPAAKRSAWRDLLAVKTALLAPASRK